MPNDMTPVEESSYALENSRPGETTLLSFVIPEDIGLSCQEAGWTNQVRISMLVSIANGEAEGVKPGDQLAAISYLDKLIKDALNTGGLLHETNYRRILVDGDTKYESDIKVMHMVKGGPDVHEKDRPAEEDQPDVQSETEPHLG